MKSFFWLFALTSVFSRLLSAAPVPPPINTPSPMLPGAIDYCAGFWQALPGETCDGIAAAHHMSTFKFLFLNPSVVTHGGCQYGGLRAYYWYCVQEKDYQPQKPAAPAPAHPQIPQPGKPSAPAHPRIPQAKPATPAHPRIPSRAEPTKPPTPARAASNPKPTSPPKADLECKIDDCWRAFKLAREGARTSQHSWCLDFLRKPCKGLHMQQLVGVPNLVGLQCTQTLPCEAVRSGCACFTAGAMETGRWEPTATP